MDIAKYIFDAILLVTTGFVFSNAVIDFKRNVNWIIYFIFAFLFVIPVFLDYAISFAGYSSGYWYGYAAVQEDKLVSIIYDIVIIALSFVFYYLLEFKYAELKVTKKLIPDDINRYLTWIFNVCLFITPILFFAFGIIGNYNPLMIFSSGWRYIAEQNHNADFLGYGAVERLTYISITCGILIFTRFNYRNIFPGKGEARNKKRTTLSVLYLIAVLVFIGLSVLIEGKRSIYLFTGAVTVFAIIYRLSEKIKIWMVIIGVAVVVGAMVPITILIAKGYRTTEALDNLRNYTSLRIDLFRDQSLKFAIYSVLHSKEISILSFPFQSYLTEIFFLFPIVYLPISFKCGYETYLTAAVNLTSINDLNPSRYTNSGLDEMVANFSFFGVALFAALIWILIKKLSDCTYTERILLITAFLLFMMYTTSYVLWYYEFLLVIWVFFKIRRLWLKRKALKAEQQEVAS